MEAVYRDADGVPEILEVDDPPPEEVFFGERRLTFCHPVLDHKDLQEGIRGLQPGQRPVMFDHAHIAHSMHTEDPANRRRMKDGRLFYPNIVKMPSGKYSPVFQNDREIANHKAMRRELGETIDYD